MPIAKLAATAGYAKAAQQPKVVEKQSGTRYGEMASTIGGSRTNTRVQLLAVLRARASWYTGTQACL